MAALPTMERLVLGLVLLAGPLAADPPRWLLPNLSEQKALDMAPDSFDDQYVGCSHLMEEELAELNRTEFAANTDYAQAWTEAAAKWRGQSVPAGLRLEQAVAITAYTLERPLFSEFNKAVREAGSSRQKYLDSFPFKVLHFLLTQAVQALRDAQSPRCRQVYRGLRNFHFTAQLGQTVRFGQFASSSLNIQQAEAFGKDTFFSVYTCYGAFIKEFSKFSKEKEVLIPPFERFRVTSATLQRGRARIELSSDGTFSSYNCELIKEKRCRGSSPCSFSAGRSISRDPSPGLWGLLLAATALAAAATP